MAFTLSGWRPRHLLLAWGAYWLVLLATVVRPALRHALAAVSAPDGHGSISANMANGVLNLVVKSNDVSWTGSASLLSIALWFAGPPLLLWAIWAATRSHPVAARERIS
jgi:hypothetical protein